MKRILVSLPVSPSAPLVITQAVELARALGAKLRLFHAVPVPAQVPPPGMFVAPAVLRVPDLVAAAETALRAYEASIPPELRDGICVEVGHTAERLCEVAHRYAPDIVVIGAHEYGVVARALGTTAARIVNRMDRPVFVVRPLPAPHAAEAGCGPPQR
jgi:nucleotide-binding universal stress UspA family protein